MPMTYDTRFLIAKLQAQAGVAADYAGSDLIPCLDLTHKALDADRKTRDLVDGIPGEGSDYLSKPRVKVTASTEASAAANAGDAPFWAALAQACGLDAVVTAGTSAVYQANASIGAHATLVGGFGGAQGAPGAAGDWLQEALDAAGTCGLTIREGELPKIDFDLTAVYGAPVSRDQIVAASPLDLGSLTSTAYQEAHEVAFDNTAFTFAGETLALRELTVSDDTPIIYSDRPNDIGTRRGRTRYTGRLVVTAPDLAVFDYFARSLAGTDQALSLTLGTDVARQFKFTAPRVQAFLSDLSDADNEVTATLDLKFLAANGTGRRFEMGAF